MAHGLTDEELDGLSDEEREAILAGDEEQDAGDDDDTGDNDNDADDEGDDEGDDGDDGDGEGDDQGDAGEADKEASNSDEPPAFAPAVDVNVFEEQQKLADITTKKAELRTKLNEGDLALDEYTEQYDALAKEERAIERNLWQAEQHQRGETQRWEWEQEQFLGSTQNALYKDKYLLLMLDAAIKDLANDPKNAADRSKKGPWYLAEADRIVRERLGKPAPVKQADKGGRRHPTMPPTLSGMPSAEHPDVGGGDEFSHLDRLEGFDLEAALAKMTPEQELRYLSVRG